MTAPHLVLFLTGSNSLATWERAGILERETALYRTLRKRGLRVSIVSYGGRSELRFQQHLGDVEILCNRWGLPGRVYARLIPWLHARALRSADVIKTNQTFGADVALCAARRWKRPLVVRCGFVWSRDAEKRGCPDEAARARRVEEAVFSAAARIVTTAPLLRDYILERIDLPRDRFVIIPNYVDTEFFKPNPSAEVPRRLVSVGRLIEAKNLPNLVEACAGLDGELWLVGEGDRRAEVEAAIARHGSPVRMLGAVPQRDIPAILQSAPAFLLVSKWEGHPKALLEAMACGLAVIGSDAPGVGDVLRHEETGLVCGTDPGSIRAAIDRLLGDAALRRRLGATARQYVLDTCSLERVADAEERLLAEVVASNPRPCK